MVENTTPPADGYSAPRHLLSGLAGFQAIHSELRRKGPDEEFKSSYDLHEPNVIFTDDPDDDSEWPKSGREASEFWVIVIDYHF